MTRRVVVRTLVTTAVVVASIGLAPPPAALAVAPSLTVSKPQLNFGSVPAGTSRQLAFTLTNTGGSPVVITAVTPPATPFQAPSPVTVGQSLAPGSQLVVDVVLAPTAVTGPLSAGYTLQGDDGSDLTVTLTGRGSPAQVAIPGPAVGPWKLNGSATQQGDDTVLTTAAGGPPGSAVYRTPVPTDGLHVSFTARIGGGSGADGMTFALLDAAVSSPSSLGGGGSGLGFGGLTGVAAALDTYQSPPDDPSSNFIGIATSAGGPPVASVHYVRTLVVPVNLRARTHTVDVEVHAGRMTFVLDGRYELDADVAVPPLAYVAFTAGTGASTDVHTVRAVAASQAPPTGQIASSSIPCLQVGATSVPAPAQSGPCAPAGRRTWTAGGDGALVARSGCLDADGTVGAAVIVAPCTGSVTQAWSFQRSGTILQDASNLCLSLQGSRRAVRTPAVLDTCHPARAVQQWRLVSSTP